MDILTYILYVAFYGRKVVIAFFSSDYSWLTNLESERGGEGVAGVVKIM
jgi:hypothetical protein